jgi:hypothetical protein
MSYSFPIDPEEVLSVDSNATSEQIRQAYRDKAKRHHPDTGGESWAFRIVTQSYEWLTMNRVSRRLREEEAREAERARRPQSTQGATPPPPKEDSQASWHDQDETAARRAMHDTVSDPTRLVDIEFFTIRYAINDPTELIYSRPEDLTLACTLNVSWPPRELDALARRMLSENKSTQKNIIAALKQTMRVIRPQASHIMGDERQFSAWLSYATQTRASDAFKVLRSRLNERQLGVAQWMREMIVPKTPH